MTVVAERVDTHACGGERDVVDAPPPPRDLY